MHISPWYWLRAGWPDVTLPDGKALASDNYAAGETVPDDGELPRRRGHCPRQTGGPLPPAAAERKRQSTPSLPAGHLIIAYVQTTVVEKHL